MMMSDSSHLTGAANQTAHTPGPWFVSCRSEEECWRVMGTSRYGPQSYSVADVINGNGYPENAANARLIAAAPDLLAVLETIVRVADGRTIPGNLILDENSPLMDAARTAIANAAGSPS